MGHALAAGFFVSAESNRIESGSVRVGEWVGDDKLDMDKLDKLMSTEIQYHRVACRTREGGVERVGGKVVCIQYLHKLADFPLGDWVTSMDC
jgi:hypothetical protein